MRKYYRQDLAQRLREAFAPPRQQGYGGQYGGPPRDPRFGGRDASRDFPRDNSRRPPFGGQVPFGNSAQISRSVPRGPYQVSSPQLAQSSLMRGQRSSVSSREALLLQCLLNHPWLMHEHLEEVAALEFANPDALRLRDAIVGEFSHDGHLDDPAAEAARLKGRLAAAGFSEILQRLERSITTGAVWGTQLGAAPDDVLATWHQLVSLHRQRNSLTRELKDAEAALGQDPSEQNYAWLRDVKSRLEAVDGTEALIEGFGGQSGRTQSGT